MEKRMFGIFVILLSFFLAATQINAEMKTTSDDSAVTEVTTNPGVEIVGNIKVRGNGSGIEFPDGTIQTTASAPTWHQILPSAERFELVMGYNAGGVMLYPAVLDKETGLVWQRDTDNTPKTWFEAWVYCYQLTLGARKGWRLPTIEELSTLVDPSQSNPALPLGHPFTNCEVCLLVQQYRRIEQYQRVVRGFEQWKCALQRQGHLLLRPVCARRIWT